MGTIGQVRYRYKGMEMKFSEIVEKLGNVVVTSSLETNPGHNPEINGVAAIDEAVEGTISYVEGGKFVSFIQTTAASAVILANNAEIQNLATERGLAWVATREPRLAFAEAIAIFYQPWQPQPEIHPTAVIHETAKIGANVHIGAYTVIQPHVEIGDDVCIHPHVVIYPHVKIGRGSLLHSHCTIHERTQVGSYCVIHSGAVIGAEGFGFVPTPTGWMKMQQSGYTVLEDGVEIGCNTAIDRPAVGETRIGKYTVIDNLVQVGHGCKTGNGCAIAGQAGMAGGVILGNRVILGGQTGVSNQAKIGDGAIASAKAGVHNDIPPGEIVSGSPAIPYKKFLRVSAVFSRLPEMYQSLREIQRQLKSNTNLPKESDK